MRRCLEKCNSENIFYFTADETTHLRKTPVFDFPFDDLSVIFVPKGSNKANVYNIESRTPTSFKVTIIITGINDDISFPEMECLYETKNNTLKYTPLTGITNNANWHMVDDANYFMADNTASILKMFLDAMVNKQTIQATVKRTYKKSKKNYVTKNITYICNKKYISSIKGHREMNWTHCFSVCGHWVKVSGIGKNRIGDYCIKGFTWRLPHKRIKDKPIINKIRILK